MKPKAERFLSFRRCDGNERSVIRRRRRRPILLREDASRAAAEAVPIGAGVASLVAVAFTLAQARHAQCVGTPDFLDFAYLGLTIGMTSQVSDTDLTHKQVRRSALHHALLSHVFGTVIVAITVSSVATLL
jgi:uncharacterized membrane protein